MPKFGKSLREALQDAGVTPETANGTVFYNGEDGNRAVYDVTASNEGAMIVNGNHVAIEGKIAVARGLPAAEGYFQQNQIDIYRGWQRVP